MKNRQLKTKLIFLFLILSFTGVSIQGCSTFEYEKCYQLDLSKIPELQPILEITGNVVITPCFKIYLDWEDIRQGNFANMVKVWFSDGKWNTELIKVEKPQEESDASGITKRETVNPVKVDVTTHSE